MFRLKYFLTTIATFFLFQQAFSQAQLSVSSSFFLSDYLKDVKASGNAKTLSDELVTFYDLYLINGKYYVGVILVVDYNQLDEAALKATGAMIATKLPAMLTARVPVHQLEALQFVEGVQFIETGEPVSPDLERSLYDTRVDSVHLGLGDLEMPYDGGGVIIAIIDWGFDYTHPVFYDSTLSHLRISRAWDQNKMSGPAPAGYNFGTEYVGSAEILAAQEDTLYVFGPGSHGTHVGGIAGGGGANGATTKGMAPAAELIFISLRRNAPSLIDAYDYVHNYAQSVGKRYVVNMSFGSHLGPHDGSSLENQGIDHYISEGGVSVASAGNNGDIRFHISRDFSQSVVLDTLTTVVNFENIADSWGTTLSMWGSANTDFQVRLIFSENNFGPTVILGQTDFFNSSDNQSLDEPIVVSGTDTLFIRMQAVGQVSFNNKPNIRMELKRKGNFRVTLQTTSADSEVHVWSNVRMNNRYTNWGVPLTNNFPDAERGDMDYGLGEPGGVGKSVITVASHIPDLINAQGIVNSGNLSGFSSLGPTVDGRTKPDISGPGQQILSAVNSFIPSNNNLPNFVEFNGKNYPLARFSGTSMSSPAVAGIAALMLQANDYLTAAQIRDVIKETARLDVRTGQIGEEGTLNWGWGKINALAAIKVAEELPNYSSVQIAPNHVKIYPNPTNQWITIEGLEAQSFKIFDLSGKVALESRINSNQIDVGRLSSGIYLILISTADNQAVFNKFVKQ